MINEDVREEHPTWSPAPQLPKLAPPVYRAGTPAGSLGSAAGVEADSFWDDALGVISKVAPLALAAI
ncbi:hypothetical protein BX285_6909 [Streptomyces sp. 1114.5]|uniref:hypothetical protein n=1 Tax=unclassified Streptomyces TaxID=2593676 RepID=UPI000BCBAF9E|nr:MULTISPECIES: hypothetical protein [unclassified Streptomyces]RKT09803.1 hypothetical protein BX285_6909 [Streptomyces sp. 1114.5]SOB88846.1 hypothetical protein SAMN06272789_7166 [Streptomyces sp. 1331.2]